ncbi:hypothetical protein D6D13_02368 [Aureobasidium pullulans]|uniref:Ig-like domain-containing protein n=1 Tax=Aureobasidium pullulans TaxID=5580 RepID=A0A4V4J233_AURPU|nr:hypothetical protein D6D13_02368 [Aureobasidium pullulans]
MKYSVSIAALFAVSAQSASALSTLSTRIGLSTATITSTSFQTATSTITSFSDLTSTVTACHVGTATPIDQAIPMPFLLPSASACTSSIFGSGSVYWNRKCSGSSLSGGTTIRAYANNQGIGAPLSLAVMACSMLPSYGTPCAGINVYFNGYMTQYYLVNGDLALESAAANVGVIEKYTTNPCEGIATATTTSLYPVIETVAAVYTSTYETSYLETITVLLPDPTTSIASNTSTPFSIRSNTTTSAPAVTLPPVLANRTSTRVILPAANATSNTTLPTLVPFLNSTTVIIIPVAVIANSTIISSFTSASSFSNSTITAATSYNHTSATATPSTNYTGTPSSSSLESGNPRGASLASISNTTSATFADITRSSTIYLNTTFNSNFPTATSSSPAFQNTFSLPQHNHTASTSSVTVAIAFPTIPNSLSTGGFLSSIARSSSSGPIPSTVQTTAAFSATACPSTVEDCPASQKTTFLATQTIAEYSIAQTAAPASSSSSTTEHGVQETKYTTSTVYSTSIKTVTACPPGVVSCPASEKTTYYTDVVLAYTTICPVSAVATSVVATITHAARPTNSSHSSLTSVSNLPSRKVSYTTSTLYSTSTQTITACMSGNKICPASEKTAYFTDVVKMYTTICPVLASTTEVAGIYPATPQSSDGSNFAISTDSSSAITDIPSSPSTSISTSAMSQVVSMYRSKVVVASDTAAASIPSAIPLFTVDGRMRTSTVGLPVVLVSSSASTIVVSQGPVASWSESAGARAAGHSDASIPYVKTDATSSHVFVTTIPPHKNTTPAASSTAKSNATSAIIHSSATHVLYTGSASVLQGSILSTVIGLSCFSLGIAVIM